MNTSALDVSPPMIRRAPVVGWCGLAVVGIACAWIGTPLLLVVWLVPVTWAATVDAHTNRLPDRIVIPGISVLAAVLVVSATWAGWPRIAGPLAGAAVLGVPFLALHVATPAGFGFGDVKFGVLLGLGIGLVRPGLGVVVFATAAIFQLIVAWCHPWPVQRIAGADRRSAPFGPSLAIASTVLLLFHVALRGGR